MINGPRATIDNIPANIIQNHVFPTTEIQRNNFVPIDISYIQGDLLHSNNDPQNNSPIPIPKDPKLKGPENLSHRLNNLSFFSTRIGAKRDWINEVSKWYREMDYRYPMLTLDEQRYFDMRIIDLQNQVLSAYDDNVGNLIDTTQGARTAWSIGNLVRGNITGLIGPK